MYLMNDKYKKNYKNKQSIWVAGLHSSSAPMLKTNKTNKKYNFQYYNTEL